jgi:hypothetical protein
MTRYIEILFYIGNERQTQLYRLKNHEIKRDDSIPLIRIKSIELGDKEPRFDQRKLDSIRVDLEHYLIAKFGTELRLKKNSSKQELRKGVEKFNAVPLHVPPKNNNPQIVSGLY